jgi:hypothetical protein
MAGCRGGVLRDATMMLLFDGVHPKRELAEGMNECEKEFVYFIFIGDILAGRK